jgi:hypothetical protein
VEFTQNTQTVNFIVDLGLPFPGFFSDEKDEVQTTEETVTLACDICKSEWQVPKKAIEHLERKGLPKPNACKQCSRKKNVHMSWH